MGKFGARMRVVWGVIVLATGLLVSGPAHGPTHPPAP
jgi:hypothetical protein